MKNITGSCFKLGKVSFVTKRAAKKFSKMAMGRYHKKYRVYHCPYCGHYHLTTLLKEKQNGK